MIKPLRDHLEMTFRASIPSVDKNKGKWGEALAGLSMILIREPNRDSVTIGVVVLGVKHIAGKAAVQLKPFKPVCALLRQRVCLLLVDEKAVKPTTTLPSQYQESC